MESLQKAKSSQIESTMMYRIHGLLIEVKIKDMRTVWGRTDYLISPLAGKGMSWVEESQLSSID